MWWTLYCHHSKCSWNRCNTVWAFWDEPDSGHVVCTLHLPTYHCPAHTHTPTHTNTHTHTTTHKITLKLLQNKKIHSKLIEQIRTKVQELEQRKWKLYFRWMKAHARHLGNEMGDQQSKSTKKYYIKIPKCVVMGEQKVQSFKSIIETKRNTNFTAIVREHININTYLYKYKIIDEPTCPWRKDLQIFQHILFDCSLQQKEWEKI